jgi:hypothetical protein
VPDIEQQKTLFTMTIPKKMKFLKNLAGWASFNSKKWKHENLEEKENVSSTSRAARRVVEL